MTNGRRRARSLALQILYEADVAGHQPIGILERLRADVEISPENFEFVSYIVDGTWQNRKVLDQYIQKFAPTFPVEQLSVVDRNILRMAIFELVFSRSMPVQVVINEAVELAKRFGGDTSSSFVNGVLGSAYQELVKMV